MPLQHGIRRHPDRTPKNGFHHGLLGSFRVASTRHHLDTLHLYASRAGYLSQDFTVLCGPSCAITANFRLLRIVRRWLDGPSTMQVGEIAAISLIDEYDDGSR